MQKWTAADICFGWPLLSWTFKRIKTNQLFKIIVKKYGNGMELRTSSYFQNILKREGASKSRWIWNQSWMHLANELVGS